KGPQCAEELPIDHHYATRKRPDGATRHGRAAPGHDGTRTRATRARESARRGDTNAREENVAEERGKAGITLARGRDRTHHGQVEKARREVTKDKELREREATTREEHRRRNRRMSPKRVARPASPLPAAEIVRTTDNWTKRAEKQRKTRNESNHTG